MYLHVLNFLLIILSFFNYEKGQMACGIERSSLLDITSPSYQEILTRYDTCTKKFVQVKKDAKNGRYSKEEHNDLNRRMNELIGELYSSRFRTQTNLRLVARLRGRMMEMSDFEARSQSSKKMSKIQDSVQAPIFDSGVR